MKYITVLCDGMSDYPLAELGDRTPLEAAHKPNMDYLAGAGEIGLARTVPYGMKPGSDIANLAVLGYDSRECYTGRSPLEAVSIGINLLPTDVAVRCNLVTLSNEANYEDKYMMDYSAGELDTATARELISFLAKELPLDGMELYGGFSYRHCLVMHDSTTGTQYYPPHDISGKAIRDKLPTGLYGEKLAALQRKSYELLRDHPVNVRRRAEGRCEVSSIWLWGEGTKPKIGNFTAKTSKTGAMISAVDLLKGIALSAGMTVIDVEGATGTINTNFLGKAKAALNALKTHDFVYIHLEAPDECGHQGNTADKIRSIELIDKLVIGTLLEGLKDEHFAMLVCPDHPTPISTRTHASDPVPYILYDSVHERRMRGVFNESTAARSGVYISEGYTLSDKLFGL